MRNYRKVSLEITIITIVLTLFVVTMTSIVQAQSKIEDQTVKNVIVLVPDGCGATQITIARWFKGAPLALDEMLTGAVRTYGANSIITDSAPAASAFATGYKTNDGFISVLPDSVTIPGVPPISSELKYKPVATVLEGAKLKGKAVGLVVTCIVPHATPAAFSAHLHDRRNYNELAEQQVYLDMDVVFGGGRDYLLPTAEGGKRTDGEDLIGVLQSKGYAFIETRDELLNINPKKVQKVWGIFAEDAMAHDFDRALHQEEPSLAEMTKKAIDILSIEPKGFFLLVEGSQVDQSSHANDPIGVISDFLAFDDAVQIALEFAKKDGKTLVLAFPDHDTGGMSLGWKGTDATYSKLPYGALVDPLKKATLTGVGIGEVLKNTQSTNETEEIIQVVQQYYGIKDLKATEIQAIINANKTGTPAMDYVVGPMISTRSVIGWTTTGHTGEDLPFYAYGPNRPIGLMENTDIAKTSARSLDINLTEVDNRLFVQADIAFSAIGATVQLDNSDPFNMVLEVLRDGQIVAQLPLSKNIIVIGSETYEMEGRTIYAPRSGKTYVPQQAVKLVQKSWIGRHRVYESTAGYGLNMAVVVVMVVAVVFVRKQEKI